MRGLISLLGLHRSVAPVPNTWAVHCATCSFRALYTSGISVYRQPFRYVCSFTQSCTARFCRQPQLQQRKLNCVFSTQANRPRVKTLMTATYISVIIGGCLLTAVGFRAYDRFKKRARGIEEVDEPLYGRRSRVLCRYRGYVLPTSWIDTIVNDVPWFEVRPDDVWVVSFPKAGTTWLQEIVYLLCNDFDFEKAKAETIEVRFPYLEYMHPGIKAVAAAPSPRFVKTHLPFSLLPKDIDEKKPKIIYIARNPKDTSISLLSFVKLMGLTPFFGTTEDYAELFINGTVVYGPWWKHVQEGWERRNDDNVLFITYEDLQKDFGGVVREVARFLNKTVTEDQVDVLARHCSFDSMKNNDTVNYTWYKGFWQWKEGNFFRRGVIGDWKNHLSAEVAQKFDAMVAQLDTLGLQFVDTPPDQN